MRMLKENFMVVIMVVCMLALFLVAGISIRDLKKQCYSLSKNVETLSSEIDTLKEQQSTSEDSFKLLANKKVYNAGAVNGISKAELSIFKIESPYPTVIYQILNADGGVISQEMKQGNAKLNTITLDKIPEEMTQVRILGFDETGVQCSYKIYDFGYID